MSGGAGGSVDITNSLDALQFFAGRQREIDIFRELTEMPAGEPLPLWCIHGPAGVGKSALVRRLRDLLENELPALPFALLDFEDRTHRDPVNGMTWLRVELEQGFQVRSPGFDIVRAVLAEKEGGLEAPLAPVSGYLRGPLAVLGSLLAPAGAAMAGGRPILDELKDRYPWIEEKVRQLGGTEAVLAYRKLERQQLVDRMLRAFAEDVSAGQKGREGFACQAVLFVDSYEQLWTGTEGPTGPQSGDDDWWLRDLSGYLAQTGRVLVILAGRECVAWSPIGGSVRDTPLLGLSEEEAQEYLAKAGVGYPPSVDRPTALQSAIIRCSTAGKPEFGCHPLYVGLCANIVLNERASSGSDPRPETFADMPDNEVAGQLAARFLRSLPNRAQAELVRDLSLPRWFDFALAKARLGGNEPPARAAYGQVSRYSFVRAAEGRALRMHPVMRQAIEHLLEAEEPALTTSLHQWFREHWEARYRGGEGAAGAEAWYHWLHLEPTPAFRYWQELAEASRDGRQSARSRELVAWWDDVDLTTDAWRERVGDREWASLVHGMGYWLIELRPAMWQHGALLRSVIACHQAALRVYTEADFPSDWAATQNDLGIAYCQLPTRDRAEDLGRAIACYEAARRVFTEADFPALWALTQNNLGNAYAELPTGDRAENLHQAITCYEAALRVQTEADFPTDWAMTQNNLGIAYRHLPTGDRAGNLRQAIVCYLAALRAFTEADFPMQWAMTQSNLGEAYRELLTGDRADNLRQAIACHRAALRVRTEADFPSDWAATQNNLGIAYALLPTGDRAANLRQAIDCFEAALRVRTEADFPTDWAMTQNNLGNAYRQSPAGDPARNLRQAIDCFKAALRVYTEADFPTNWAGTQYNLGIACADLPAADRAGNLRQAMDCFKAALRVYTEADFPTDWATTQYNLGNASVGMPTGDRAGNLRQAIACYRAALQVFTEADFPTDWARTQNNLGYAYSDLPTGDRAGNLREAIACYQAALRVRTEADSPTDWARTQSNLGMAYQQLPTGDRKGNLGRAIGCYEAALRVGTEADFPADWALLMGNLALAYDEVGDAEAAEEVRRQLAQAPGDGTDTPSTPA